MRKDDDGMTMKMYIHYIHPLYYINSYVIFIKVDDELIEKCQ